MQVMEPPPQIHPQSLNDYLEVLTKIVFQAGLSWRAVEAKWPGFRQAFAEFDPHTVASLTPVDTDRLAQDTRIIRNRRKIDATIENAEALLQIERDNGTFKQYLGSNPNTDELARDLAKRFKFLSPAGAKYFLYVVGESDASGCPYA
jgi:3-methyladenine DNA glycosylase Tag